jgi:hypothetical protein
MTSPFSNSPLFRQASRAIQREARRAFDQSDFGRLTRQVRQIVGSRTEQTRTQRQVGDLLRNHVNFTPEKAARQLMGADFGALVREVQRYSRQGGGRQILGDFLKSLGPAGSMIKALVDGLGGGQRQGQAVARQITSAANLLRSFGFEILPLGRNGFPTLGDVNRGASAACEYLESLGYEVSSPEEQEAARRCGESILPQPEPNTYHVDLPFGTTTRRFLASHPIVTGKMVRATGSSNVWAFGYAFNEGALYVRFAKKGQGGVPSGPGPLYRYPGVTPDQFLSMLNAGSKGMWIWDNLRIRGTIPGQQKDYELLETVPTPAYPEAYVPRKATVEPVVRHGVRGQRSQFASTIGARGPLGPGGPRGGR